MHKIISNIKFIILLSTLYILQVSNYCQTYNLIVDHLTLRDGLPSEIVNCVHQDKFGFIWFGTNNALVKYDGYNMKTSFNGRWINSIAEDKKGNFWCASTILIYYSREDTSYKFFKRKEVIPFPYIQVNVAHKGYHFMGYNGAFSKLYIDKKQNLWIGTYSYGLYKLNLIKYEKEKNSPEFQLMFHDLKNEGTQSINAIAEDNENNIWIVTNNGLVKIQNNSFEIQYYQSVKSEKYNTKNHFTDILVDHDTLWLSSFGHGLCKFNITEATFEYISLKKDSDPKEFTNEVYTIAMPKDHTIMCGMKGHSDVGGIVSLDLKSKRIVRHIFDPQKEYGIGPYQYWVNDIFIDNCETIWGANRVGPIERIVPERNQIKYVYSSDLKVNAKTGTKIYDIQSLSGSEALILSGDGILLYNSINDSFTQKYTELNDRIRKMSKEKSILLDSKGILWIGHTNGVLNYSPVNKKIINIKTNTERKPCIIAEDKNNIYWISTFGKGLIKYNTQDKTVKYFKSDPQNSTTIKDDFINNLYCDKDSSVWLGTNEGYFIRFDTNKEVAENYTGRYSAVVNVGPFNGGSVWFATAKNGFVIFNKESGKFKRISVEEGLPHSFNYGAIKDKNGDYWIITSYSVTKYDFKDGKIHNFEVVNKNNHLKTNLNKTKNYGDIFLRAEKGFYHFDPDELTYNRILPKMALTDIKIFNKSILNDKDSIFTKSIEFTDAITLPYNKNDITFEFAALHYVEPQKNQYKYILENYDNDWQNVGYERTARYTSLPHGDYIFKVLGSNSDGVWATEPATLSITILPPWWKTWWAYLLYSLLLISILSYLYYLQRRRLRFKHEFEIKEFEAAKLKEVDHMKSKFFANISHEFRTPLTLIIGPVEKLFENTKIESTKKIYKVILRNAERLLNLINELLDLSKLESGKMKLSAQKSDIVSFVKGIAMSFESFAKRKEIQISINSNKEIIELFFDKEKMQKILTNLISNACKFSKQNGKINIKIEEDILNEKVLLSVIDFGIGISEKDLPRIFDRFYQVSNNEHTDQIGTGIGLSLAKELVEMHHGNIEVESEKSKGTTFTISLLFGKNHFTDDEIIYNEKEYKEITIFEDEVFKSQYTDNEETTLLIVEDNKDVRNFIKSIVQTKYRIIEAEDGKEGYDKAIEFIPDIILSDIMMPKMSGDKMAESLKNNLITSHIPIILLTAKASDEDKLNGLETGADDYLIKPFHEKELLARIKNLIKQRKKLKEKYLREAEINPIEVAVTSLDKKFIEKVLNLVEHNLSKPEFSIDHLVKDLAVSRTQLYRKFDSILGEKPNDFIRKYRIKRAAELIKKEFGNITEIAYEVGFNDLSYFSKCFKKTYNVTPHEYTRNIIKNKNL